MVLKLIGGYVWDNKIINTIKKKTYNRRKNDASAYKTNPKYIYTKKKKKRLRRKPRSYHKKKK